MNTGVLTIVINPGGQRMSLAEALDKILDQPAPRQKWPSRKGRYARIKADPVKHAAYLKKQREQRARRKQEGQA